MLRTAVALRALAVACAFGAGCSLIAGLEEHGRLPDAGPGDAGPGDCDAGSCPGCAAKIVYVSESGNDASDGCKPEAPKRTVSGAIGYVKTIKAIDHEIHVCAGTYSEPQVVVDYPVSLKGGYECTTWLQTDTYGFPTFDGTNETLLVNAAPVAEATATVVVRGASVGRGVVIDGFTVVGTSVSTTESIGGRVEDGATPTLSNDVLLGGSGPNFSAALDLRTGADADIQRCSLHGGTATITFGVYVLDSVPHLHDSEIVGGDTTGVGTGIGINSSSALELGAASGTAVELNNIVGNLGGGRGVGVGVDGAVSVELRHNLISGGAAQGDNSAHGVVAKTAGTMRIHANRIVAGTHSSSGPQPPMLQLFGVHLDGSSESEIVNNMIHGGAVVAGEGETFGITLLDTAGALVAHNTIFAGIPGAAGGSDIFIDNPTGLEVRNNLLVGTGVAGYGFMLLCNGSLTSVENNAFVNHVNGVALVAGDCPTESIVLVKHAETLLSATYPSATVQNNVAVAADCGAEAPAKCAEVDACGSPSEMCVESLFAQWTGEEGGLPELLSPEGWPLAARSPCAISKGGLDLTTTVTHDALDDPRTDPVSIGALEFDAECLP